MLAFFPQVVLDEILNLIESVSEGFPSYSSVAVPQCYMLCPYIWISALWSAAIIITILFCFVIKNMTKR